MLRSKCWIGLVLLAAFGVGCSKAPPDSKEQPPAAPVTKSVQKKEGAMTITEVPIPGKK